VRAAALPSSVEYQRQSPAFIATPGWARGASRARLSSHSRT